MINNASATLNYPGCCCGTTCAQIAMQEHPGMYDMRHEQLAIHFIFYTSFGFRLGPTTWSVSCCCPAVLLLAVILLLYCRIHYCVHCTTTYNRDVPFGVPAPNTFLRSSERPAKYKTWPIRHWDGDAHPNPY